MHCFASENPTYTGTWLFGVESWKSLKGQENLLRKNLQVKTRVENVRFLSYRIFFVGKYGIQSTNEMAFKRTVPLREFSISRHQIWFAHAIVVQRMHACACKMPSCSIRTSNLKCRHIQARKKDVFVFDFFCIVIPPSHETKWYFTSNGKYKQFSNKWKIGMWSRFLGIFRGKWIDFVDYKRSFYFVSDLWWSLG